MSTRNRLNDYLLLHTDTSTREVWWRNLSVTFCWLGLLGPAWLYVPAQPDHHIPPADLHFAALATLTAHSPSGLQAVFFGWLAWVFAFLPFLFAAALQMYHTAIVGAVTCVVAVTEIALTLAAIKGAQSMTTTLHTLSHVRLGEGLYLLGLVLMFEAGYAAVRSALYQRWIDRITPPVPSAAWDADIDAPTAPMA